MSSPINGGVQQPHPVDTLLQEYLYNRMFSNSSGCVKVNYLTEEEIKEKYGVDVK